MATDVRPTKKVKAERLPKSIQACLACKRTKLRCTDVDDALRCARCRTRGLECQWATGMMPTPTASTDDAFQASQQQQRHTLRQVSTYDRLSEISGDNPLAILNAAALGDYSPSDVADMTQRDLADVQTRNGWSSKRLREIRVERMRYFSVRHAPEPELLGGADVMERASLSDGDAEELFALFFTSLNRQTSIADGIIHRDWRSTRKRSTLLFLVILAVSSAVHEDPRFVRAATILSRDMDECVSRVILANATTLEVAQALHLAYLYPCRTTRLADDRSWLLLDTASRILTDLDAGHQFSTTNGERSTTGHDVQRERRNAERTFLASLVLEKSFSTFVGAKRQRAFDMHWSRLDEWSQSTLATSGDVQSVAYLNVRRLEHAMYGRLAGVGKNESLEEPASLQAWANAQFEQWKQRWLARPQLQADNFTREFTLLVGLHVQLLMNVKALHAMQATQHVERDAAKETCKRLAGGLCRHFLQHFARTSHHFCRNPVAMVVSSALILLQLDPLGGKAYCWDVAFALAGNGDDTGRCLQYSAFLGRTLLSIISDMSLSGRGAPSNDATDVRYDNAANAKAHGVDSSSVSANMNSSSITPADPFASPSDMLSGAEIQWDDNMIRSYIDSILNTNL